MSFRHSGLRQSGEACGPFFSCRLKSAPSAAATSSLASRLHKKMPRFQKWERGCGGSMNRPEGAIYFETTMT